jgi:hypothetical protein
MKALAPSADSFFLLAQASMAMKTKVLYIPSVINRTALNMRRFLFLLLSLCLLPLAAMPSIATAQEPPDPPDVRMTGSRIRLGEQAPRTPTNPQDATDGKTPTAEFHMARMVYDGNARGRGRFGFNRGWWAIDYPQAEIHYIGGIRRLTNIDSSDDSHHIPLTDDAIFDHPWLFAQQIGQGYWDPSTEEAARLREYLLKGGFLVLDDFHGGEWQIMVDAMKKVLPNHSIVDLTTADELFHVLYDLDTLTQIPGQRHLRYRRDGSAYAQLDGPQRWSGIYDDEGRLMVAINFNMDMGDAWEHADDPSYPEPMTALAYRFGINYLIYAMTH